MCIYYLKVILFFLCVNIVFNFLELFLWFLKIIGNIRFLFLNWFKDLGVGIVINFYFSFCVVFLVEIFVIMDIVFGYLFYIFW